MEEIWRDVSGYEEIYQVSNLGNVKSLDRYVTNNKGKRLSKGKVLAQQIDSSGYPYVHLSVKGFGKNKKVHRLVAESFCVKSSETEVVNHLDGDKKNNNANNLEWCSHQQNTQHAIDTGSWKNIGENASSNILKEQEVLEIRNNHTDPYDKLAERYGVKKSTIADIKKFRSWKHLGGANLLTISEDARKDFPAAILKARKEKGLSRRKFAEFLRFDISAIGRWERGETFPTDNTLRAIQEKLNKDFITS